MIDDIHQPSGQNLAEHLGWDPEEGFSLDLSFQLLFPDGSEGWLEVARVEDFVVNRTDGLELDAGFSYPRERHGAHFIGRLIYEDNYLEETEEKYSSTMFDAYGNDTNLGDSISDRYDANLGFNATPILNVVRDLDDDEALLGLSSNSLASVPGYDEDARGLIWHGTQGSVIVRWSSNHRERWTLVVAASMRIPISSYGTFVGYRQYTPETYYIIDPKARTVRVEHFLSHTDEWEPYDQEQVAKDTFPTPTNLEAHATGAPEEIIEVPLPFDTDARLVLQLIRMSDYAMPVDENAAFEWGEHLLGDGSGHHHLGTFALDEEGDGSWFEPLCRAALTHPTADHYASFEHIGQDRDYREEDIEDEGDVAFNVTALATFIRGDMLGRRPHWNTTLLDVTHAEGKTRKLAWRRGPGALWCLEVVESGAQSPHDGLVQHYVLTTTYALDWEHKTMAFSQEFVSYALED